MAVRLIREIPQKAVPPGSIWHMHPPSTCNDLSPYWADNFAVKPFGTTYTSRLPSFAGHMLDAKRVDRVLRGTHVFEQFFHLASGHKCERIPDLADGEGVLRRWGADRLSSVVGVSRLSAFMTRAWHSAAPEVQLSRITHILLRTKS